MSAFLTTLDVRLLKDNPEGSWGLLSPFIYSSDILGVTKVPAGFQTDFCSVPRLPFIYESLGNTGRRAGVIHDFLYTEHPCSRETADAVLREALEQDGVSHFKAQAFYLAVRGFGQKYWDKP